MKTIMAITLIFSVALHAFAADEPLLPDGVNQILGRIRPNMSEAELEKLVKAHYPEAKATPSVWSGQTGYVEFKLTSRHSISVAEYKDPKGFKSRFVHAHMIFYVYDWELKRRINISFHKWDDETKKGAGKTSEQTPAGDVLKAPPEE